MQIKQGCKNSQDCLRQYKAIQPFPPFSIKSPELESIYKQWLKKNNRNILEIIYVSSSSTWSDRTELPSKRWHNDMSDTFLSNWLLNGNVEVMKVDLSLFSILSIDDACDAVKNSPLERISPDSSLANWFCSSKRQVIMVVVIRNNLSMESFINL